MYLRMHRPRRALRGPFGSKRGQDSFEYAPVLALLAPAAAAGMSSAATQINAACTKIRTTLTAYNS